MQIIMKKIKEIQPYENNPRNNKKAVEFVMNSIKEFGFKQPIVIDGEGVIVCGHTRYQASKKLKLKEVPCILADDLNEQQIKAFRLADNKTSEWAEWDLEKLEVEMEEITMDLSGFGFMEIEEDEIDAPLEEEEGEGFGGVGKPGFDITFKFKQINKQKINDIIKENGKENIAEQVEAYILSL